jgi:diaminopimelate decarboxylase
MHHFKYKNNNLYCESVRIIDIAEEVDTPFYLYSYRTLLDHYKKIKEAFSELKPLVCFSMKSNSNLSVCKALVNAGAGLDIVSGGELFKAIKIKADPKKIVYASVGKTALEIDKALRAGILFFNVESISEMVVIEKLCARTGRRASIAVRVNPDVETHTHHYITTGTQDNKFGIDKDTVVKIFNQKRIFSHLDILGLHIHIGSQITESAPFVEAIKRVSSLIEALRRQGHRIEYLNIGGGLGIIYHNEKPQTAKEFARAVMPLIKRLKMRLILEPGRFISGNSGILVTKVLYVKSAPHKNFIIVDAGMNDLMRPSLYGAYHEILPLRQRRFSATRHKFDVVGPICESGDFLAKDRLLPIVAEGEYMAVMGAGGYGFSMSSNYNARPRCAEVMVIKGKAYIVRARETYKDLVRGETIPKVLR